MEVLIVDYDLDAIGLAFVVIASRGDGETCEQTDREEREQKTTVRHVPACSPENNKTRREAGLVAVA